MSELWAEEQKALLPLSKEPFEPVEFKHTKVNKYSKVKVDGEIYDLPGAWTGQPLLAKIWWDRVELLDQNQSCLGTFCRPYTMKSTPIDWKGSTLYRFLPPAVHGYLEEGGLATYRDRLKFVHSMLEKGYAIDFIASALERATSAQIKDQALIWHLLYQLSKQEKPLGYLEDHYSPPSLKNYLPQIEDYDQLMPQRKGGESSGAVLEATM